MGEIKRFVVDVNNLPPQFPTNRHSARFWESLGRAVATFGFLEEILEKAVFAFTGTMPVPEVEAEAEKAAADWRLHMKKTVTDTLNPLIDSYGSALRKHPRGATEGLDDLLKELRRGATWRNVLCHASWMPPDANGASVPFFVNKKFETIATAMDPAYIDRIQQGTAELACHVMSSVSAAGLQFPGSDGPGEPVV